MKTLFSRRSAMSPRVLAAAIATLSAVALAQSDDYSAPPMVPVDAPVDQPPPAPPPQQPQQQSDDPQQQLEEQSHQPVQPLPADYVPPQQQYPQQPQQYPQQYQQPQYQQAPPQQRRNQRPEPEPVFEGTILESRRTKHFLGLATANIGLFTAPPGFTFNLRAEADIGKIPLLVGYTAFIPDATYNSINHFTAMTGWSIFSTDPITWRALGGVDVIDFDGTVALGAVFGTTFRSMFARSVGVDLAAMFTPLPFRQLELRAAIVFQFGRVFELQLGWRYQAIDATQSGNLATLFDIAPAVNGPSAAIGLTF
ncbi:MAG: hypothetical protein DI536_18260 [Archangium gephyra]|uniref:Uncharacterized protein n=1 Tax=Archangium gephyra TaxID=48 RepID=A0A2W5V5L8_9BACT|nr:MAG: hypothetical protein DI536_18260 [Archangium gephyra]